jgi:hypothetical protein
MKSVEHRAPAEEPSRDWTLPLTTMFRDNVDCNPRNLHTFPARMPDEAGEGF